MAATKELNIQSTERYPKQNVIAACEKWLLKINPKKTKTLIFQKQNRKSIRDKFSFFLNGTPIDKASQYSYLGITFSTNVMLIPKRFWLKKPDDQYLLLNVTLT